MNQPPYKIGISGQRDILLLQKEEKMQLLKGYLLHREREYPDREIVVLSSLAEGVDRWIVEVARGLGLGYEVVLPMPKSLYVQDFSFCSRLEFERLLAGARAKREIALYAGNTPELVQSRACHRSFQYRQGGREIVDSCDEIILIEEDALNQKIGSSKDIARYAKLHEKHIYTIPQQLL